MFYTHTSGIFPFTTASCCTSFCREKITKSYFHWPYSRGRLGCSHISLPYKFAMNGEKVKSGKIFWRIIYLTDQHIYHGFEKFFFFVDHIYGIQWLCKVNYKPVFAVGDWTNVQSTLSCACPRKGDRIVACP